MTKVTSERATDRPSTKRTNERTSKRANQRTNQQTSRSTGTNQPTIIRYFSELGIFSSLQRDSVNSTTVATTHKYMVRLRGARSGYLNGVNDEDKFGWRQQKVDLITCKGPGKRGHINADTLLPTQMFPRLPARVTFVADTNFVSGGPFLERPVNYRAR